MLRKSIYSLKHLKTLEEIFPFILSSRMVHCKGCRKNKSGLLFTGFHATCDVCLYRVTQYREGNLEKVRETNAKVSRRKS